MNSLFITLMALSFIISAIASYELRKITWGRMILSCTLPPIFLSLIYTLTAGGISGLSVLIFLPTVVIFIIVSLLGGAIGAVIGERRKRSTSELNR